MPLLQLSVKSPSVHTQPLGRRGHVPAGRLEDAQDVPVLELFERQKPVVSDRRRRLAKV
jgi:hypothetical protein